jgi:hypothetical protein
MVVAAFVGRIRARELPPIGSAAEHRYGAIAFDRRAAGA